MAERLKLLFDVIFFPIWSLEQTAIGPLVEIPLDIMSIILDNMDIILEALAPIVPIIIDVVLDIGQAIPAYGTAVSAISLPFNFIEGPLEILLANITDIVGFMINISRKQWRLAYMSALSIVPIFPDIMDSFLTNITIINKWMYRLNYTVKDVKDIMTMISTNLEKYESLIHIVTQNPKMIFDMLK